jgi:hypothetical protein
MDEEDFKMDYNIGGLDTKEQTDTNTNVVDDDDDDFKMDYNVGADEEAPSNQNSSHIKDTSQNSTNEHLTDNDQVPNVEVDVDKNRSLLDLGVDGIQYTAKYAPPDMANFAVSPREWSSIPKGMTEAASNIMEFLGDLDQSTYKYLGVVTWGGDGDNKWEFTDVLPQWVAPWRTEELKKYYKEENKRGHTFYALANAFDKAQEVFPEEYETGTAGFTFEAARFLTGLKGIEKTFRIRKADKFFSKDRFKNMLSGEALTGYIIFGKDDEGLGDMLKLAGLNIPEALTQSGWDDTNDEVWVRRALGAVEGVFTGALLDSELYKGIGGAVKLVKGKEKAIKEKVKTGTISDETNKEIDDAMEELESIDIEKGVEQAKTWKLKDDTVSQARKRIEMAQNATANRTNMQRMNNEQVVNRNVGYYNNLVREFEENLSINKNNGLKRGDDGFFTISNMENNKLVIDKDKITRLRKQILTAKEEKQKYSLAGQITARSTIEGYEMGEGSIDYILDPKQIGSITADELDALSTRVLDTENIEALTTVAVELKNAYPNKWKENQSVMENIFRLSTMDELTIAKDHPLWQALDKAGMSFEDFVTAHLGSASEAGKTLNRYSQLSKRLKPKTQKQRQDNMIKRQGWLGTYFRRIENIRRGLLVSQIATAARNLESGLVRSPVESLNNIIEVGLQDIAQGKFFANNRVFQRTTWQDSFANLRYIYSDRELAKGFTDIILEQPELQKFNNQMFNTINEIQVATGRGSGTATDKVLSKMEDFTLALNAPNRWQDFLLRRATFLGEARRLFRQKMGVDLIEELENGRLKDLLRDSRDLNKTLDQEDGGVSAIELFAEATERALDLTYSSAPEVPFNKAVASFIVNNNLTVFVPFPRFMFKSMELMAENSAGALIVPIRRMIPESFGGRKGGLTQRDYRMISRNLTGGSAIMAATYLQTQKEEGEDYKLLKLDDGTMIDTTPLFPLRQYMFLGKIGREFYRATYDVGAGAAAKEAFFETFPLREALETFAGSNFRTGVAGNFVDEFAKLLTEQDVTQEERLLDAGVSALSEYFASWAVPMNQVIDAQRALEARGTVYKETAKDPEILSKGSTAYEALVKPFRRLDPTGILVNEEELPVKEDIFQETKERKGSLYKVLTGINMYSEDSDVGKKLMSLGLTKWDLQSKSKIPTIKNYENKIIRENLDKILKVAEGFAETAGREYESKRDELSSGFFGGVSKKKYVNMRIKDKIMEAVDSLRGDPRNLSVIDDKSKRIDLFLQREYRRLPTNVKTQAYYKFKGRYKRFPFAFTEDYFKSRYQNYDTYTQEQKDRVKAREKQRDLNNLTAIGKLIAGQ